MACSLLHFSAGRGAAMQKHPQQLCLSFCPQAKRLCGACDAPRCGAPKGLTAAYLYFWLSATAN